MLEEEAYHQGNPGYGGSSTPSSVGGGYGQSSGGNGGHTDNGGGGGTGAGGGLALMGPIFGVLAARWLVVVGVCLNILVMEASVAEVVPTMAAAVVEATLVALAAHIMLAAVVLDRTMQDSIQSAVPIPMGSRIYRHLSINV